MAMSLLKIRLSANYSAVYYKEVLIESVSRTDRPYTLGL